SRANPALAAGPSPQAGLAHEPFDSLVIAFMPFLAQVLRHPRAAVAALFEMVDPLDIRRQQSVGSSSRCLRAIAPGVIPAPADLQRSTEIAHRVLLGKFLNHSISLLLLSE